VLASSCLTGCQATGASASDGPTQDGVQAEVVAGLTTYIAHYCTTKKAAMLDSLKSLKYTISKQELLNTINNGHKVIRLTGTLTWAYASSDGHTTPGAVPFNTIVTNDPTSTPDHQERWEFNGIGPWQEMLAFPIAQGYCQNVRM
jgi:hypothetical protein